jgi:hypothetical protein
MAQCPKCSHDLADEYGMITCPVCSSIVFIDMDGVAQIATEPESLAPVSEMPHESPSLSESPMDLFNPEPGPEPESQSSDEPAAPLASDESGNSGEASDVSLGQSDMPFSASDPLGLADFSNSEISQAKDGPLLFKILISGIDSKEMRTFLREAITDARLNWDPDQIISKIKQGTLQIDAVSPVKATIVINRIKRLPLKIRWEQNAVTQVPQN